MNDQPANMTILELLNLWRILRMICGGTINPSLKDPKIEKKKSKMVFSQVIFGQIYQIKSGADVASGTNAVWMR